MVAVVSDRISAFDVVMPRGIPYKGQVLNGVASHFLNAVKDIVPTWNIATPDPNVTIGHRCRPIRLESSFAAISPGMLSDSIELETGNCAAHPCRME